MAEISFSLAALFEKTFGYKTRAFEPQFRQLKGNNPPERKEQGAGGSPYYANDALGTEYYMPVTLTYPDMSSRQETPPGVTATNNNSFSVHKKWNLPYPIISIESKKTIVETALTERRGTVKELIAIKDYEITIKGFLIAPTHEFPEQDVTTLRTIYEQNTAISIQCPLTDIFLLRPDRSGSDQVVISELKFHAIIGIKNIRPYELKMLSDEPFNLLSI
jgi:hypothetical protein